ncbi:hypothetical protein PISMIDRAFT_14119 [Pisolithus microcarpus 441]|uniref:Uncharacterized protein n=1 Tax=Pisolithus microcarpus 441 TaxID=765257 RepID=A0A0C9Y1X0_9AGAM|nr:hypothetical protein PISMIDRAFT_14119 [Pisolithus microcarpus 441]
MYPEIEPIEDVCGYFDEFYAFLDGSRRSELSLVPALGAYLHHFQVLFLAMVTWNALELSHRAQLFLRGLPPHVELEVSRRLASRYPLFMSDHLWPIEVIVRVTKEVIEDGVGHSPPCLASTKSLSALKSPKEPSWYSPSPSISYRPDAPVEYSWSCPRRCSQGSSSSKPPSCSPFEGAPRPLKNSPHPPELASSSSSPHRVTNAGSRHPVVYPRRCDLGWQAGDSPSNSLHSSREDQQSYLQTPRELGPSLTRLLRPREPSSTPSKCYSCFEMSSKSFGEEIPREALGHTLQARLDFWALACGPGGAAVQVKSPPSSSESSPPLVCPRGDLETTLEPLASSRAPTSPSRRARVEFRGSLQPLEGLSPPLEPFLPLRVQHPPRVTFRGLSGLEASLVFEATPSNPLNAPQCHSGTLP